MNEAQKQFIELLKAAINKEKVDLKGRTFNWDEIIEEANSHDVKGLIYSSIDKKDSDYIDKDVYENLKKDTLFSALYQRNHINRICDVFDIMREADIEIIALKGLILRNLYPNPDLRTMGDSDILINRSDLEKVKSTLYGLGYVEHNTTDYHIEFSHKLYSDIEVHWTLGKGKYIDILNKYNQDMWSNAIEVNMGKINVKSLCAEDLYLYMFVHMKGHMRLGIGVRQLCDTVLFMKKESKNIDWKSFLKKSQKINCDKFIGAILSICSRLFDIDIPKDLEGIIIQDETIIMSTIKHILDGGVHGKRNTTNKLDYIKKDILYEKEFKNKGIVKNIFQVIFPSIEKLELLYSYVGYTKLLVPIAYIQRIYEIIICDKYKIFTEWRQFKNELKIFRTKNKINKWLELQ